MEILDVIIVGGGPAGLNAAVVLGRCRRHVLVFDTGAQRNLASRHLHNYLTRDHISPAEFLKIARKELEKYDVRLLKKQVKSAHKNPAGLFVVTDADGAIYHARRLLIATGLRDKIPAVPGMLAYYGKGVHHCPYCDGWEYRDQKLGVYARHKNGHELALSLKTWSADVTLFTDGKNYLTPPQRQLLESNQVKIMPQRIEKLNGNFDKLERLVFKNGEEIPCDALFFVNGFDPQCDLAVDFDCEVNRLGLVLTSRSQKTNVEGLYVAGDACKDVQFVVVAAAEGAKAAVHINKDLQREAWNHLKGFNL